MEGGFLGALLAPLAASLVEPVILSVAQGIKEIIKEEQEEAIWIKILSSAASFKQYQDY